MSLISIGLPAFKGRYLREMLLSLKAQTYENFEVLIQDDVSPDDIRGIVRETCGGDNRFIYERNAVNSSPNFVKNWNKSLSRARGEFFVLASDDDVYEPLFLEDMVKLAEKNKDCNLFCSPVRALKADGDFEEHPLPSGHITQVELAYKLLISNEFFTVVPNFMVRTSALRSVGGFLDLPAAWGSDWWTWCRLAKHGLFCADKYLFTWRVSEINISSVESDYWLEQKFIALKRGDEPWRKLIYSMAVETEQDEIRLNRLKAMYTTSEHCRAAEGVILKMSTRKFLLLLSLQLREGECSLMHVLWLIVERGKRYVVRMLRRCV